MIVVLALAGGMVLVKTLGLAKLTKTAVVVGANKLYVDGFRYRKGEGPFTQRFEKGGVLVGTESSSSLGRCVGVLHHYAAELKEFCGQRFDLTKSEGEDLVNMVAAPRATLASILRMETFLGKVEGVKLEDPLDGVVVRVRQISTQEHLGETRKTLQRELVPVVNFLKAFPKKRATLA